MKTSHASAQTLAGKRGGSLLLRVKTPGYEPSGVEIRARVSPTLLTVYAAAADVDTLESDPEVVSISRASRIGPA